MKSLKTRMKENVIPFVLELPADTLTPVLGFMRLSRHSERAFFLESVEGGEKIARYSFLGADPFECLSIRNGAMTVESPLGCQKRIGDPFQNLQRHLERYRAKPVPGLPPFCGGAVGYIGFDCAQYLEKIPIREHPEDFPEAFFMLFRNVVIYDRVKDRIKIVANIFTDEEDLERGRERARKEAHRLASILFQPVDNEDRVFDASRLEETGNEPAFEASWSEDDYKKAVRKVKEYIRAGDIFQCVISDQFKVPMRLAKPSPSGRLAGPSAQIYPTKGDTPPSLDGRLSPFAVYRSLRALNPSPYLFYLQMGDQVLLGASPETLVKISDGCIETRPIAGTRPRGGDPASDLKLEKELLASAKECAEHLMLVDLGRNDIGRVAVPGSVRVEEFMQVQRFSNVMHLVSEVKGKLKRNITSWGAFAACFPAGTLTGAPKIRAMEIISELEPVGRGPYGGAVVYCDFSGNLDSCINIRSLMVKGEVGYIQAGAGIVADSNPQKEYEEVRHKSKALFRAIAAANAIHSLKREGL